MRSRSRVWHSGAFRRASDLAAGEAGVKAAERVGRHEKSPEGPEEGEEQASDEKVQHNTSSDSQEGHASEGAQQRPGTSGLAVEDQEMEMVQTQLETRAKSC